jgi:acetyltransferase-like isoleucine patch superfamily enzyme
MLSKYGFWGLMRLMISLIYTKIFFPKARLIRLPFDIRNRKYVSVGKGLTTGVGCRIEAFPENPDNMKCLEIGNNVEINDYVHIAARAKVQIGNNVLIASKVFISDINHGAYKGPNADSPLTPPNDRTLSSAPVFIRDNVWIGESVCVLPGVTIGEGCVIGALSVVTKDLPPYCIAVGVPAVIVKRYDFEKKEWIVDRPKSPGVISPV